VTISKDKYQIHITAEPLSPEVCTEFVKSSAAGALVTFEGWVRNATSGKEVLRLEFEAYEKMALVGMEKIVRDALDQFDILRIAMHHRTGIIEIGELPVLIAVSAAHRGEAFKACEFAIDNLKKTVPIWKKELFTDGEVWVSAHP